MNSEDNLPKQQKNKNKNATLNLNPKTEHSKKSVVSFRVIFMQNFRYTLFELYRREWTG